MSCDSSNCGCGCQCDTSSNQYSGRLGSNAFVAVRNDDAAQILQAIDQKNIKLAADKYGRLFNLAQGVYDRGEYAFASKPVLIGAVARKILSHTAYLSEIEDAMSLVTDLGNRLVTTLFGAPSDACEGKTGFITTTGDHDVINPSADRNMQIQEITIASKEASAKSVALGRRQEDDTFEYVKDIVIPAGATVQVVFPGGWTMGIDCGFAVNFNDTYSVGVSVSATGFYVGDNPSA